MVSPAVKGNDWQSQPRDAATGRFKERQGEYLRRDRTLILRLHWRERRQIAEAAASAGQTITSWVMAACEAYRRPEAPTEPQGGKLLNGWELMEHLARKRG